MKPILNLDRPLAVLDLETTGLAVRQDRIVEIAILKIHPDGKKTRYCTRVNPGIPIPPEATKVHRIRDRDVKGKPPFGKIARKVARILKGCHIAGFNVVGFDLQLLQCEFERVKVPFSTEGRSVIDCKRIFHTKEPRDLPAACQFYLDTDHDEAHSALADVRACWRVLEAQLHRYPDLPRHPAGLHDFCNPASDRYLDSGRKFERRHGQAAFAFGQYQGRFLKDVAREDPGYLDWMLRRDFPADTKTIAKKALAGKLPGPKARA